MKQIFALILLVSSSAYAGTMKCDLRFFLTSELGVEAAVTVTNGIRTHSISNRRVTDSQGKRAYFWAEYVEGQPFMRMGISSNLDSHPHSIMSSADVYAQPQPDGTLKGRLDASVRDIVPNGWFNTCIYTP